MTPNPEAQQRIRRYLLGDISDGAREELEQSLLTDGELFEELLMVEDELIDKYLANSLPAGERRQFESHFLATPQRREKLNFARAFDRYLKSQQTVAVVQTRASATLAGWLQAFFSSPLRFAAYALVLVAIGLAAWSVFFRQSDVDKGLLALNAAYREGRPIEPRISGLNYAPYSTTRGPGTERVDQNELRHAELTLLEALNKEPSPQVQHALGKVYLAKGQFDDAIKQFEEALKAQPNAQLYSDLGAAWLEKGKADLNQEPGKAMEELGRSNENLTKALELNPNALEALFNRALSREALKLDPQSEEDWRQYLQRDPNSQWTEEARRHLKLLEERKARSGQNREQLRLDFLAAYASHNDDSAWTALGRSRERKGNAIVESLLDDVSKAVIEGRPADAKETLAKVSYAGKVEFQKVGEHYTSDLASFYAAANTAALTNAARARELMGLGIKQYLASEYDQAIALFTQAHALFENAGDSPEALFAQAWIGYSYLRIPDPKKSDPIMQRLSRVFEQRRYRSLFAQSLMAEADGLSSQNEHSKVLEKANQALAISQQIRDDANVVRCLHSVLGVQLTLGNYQESLRSSFQALSLTDSLPPIPELIWPSYHQDAMNFYYLGQPMTAWQFETEALRISTQANLPLQITRSYDRLAFLSERSQNYADAIKYGEQTRIEAKKINAQRTRTNILAHSALVLAGLYRTRETRKAVALYDEALALYEQLGLDIYKYRAHKGKLLALMSLNENDAAKRELTDTLYWFETNRDKIAEESYRDKFFDTDQDTYDIAVDFAFTRNSDSAKAFDYAEASRARSLLNLITAGAQVSHDGDRPELNLRAASVSSLKLDEIQSQMPAQTQLLEYAVLDDKLIAWVVTKDGHRDALASITRAELQRKVSDYLDKLRQRTADTTSLTSAAKELYAVLISPIEAYLTRDVPIAIVPSDNLNFVPFASLMSPKSGKYLIEDYPVEIAPSATIFIRSSEQATHRRKVNSERVLIVGNPSFEHERFDLPDLPAAAREARAIASTYGTSSLIGDDATTSRVKQGLKENDVAHFATHAIADERSPLLSKLILASDRVESHHSSPAFLQASEIYELNLARMRLVVLSACQTGIERAYRGEGAVGLARPFLAAGVPLVIASLWSVESEATADLMISFHNHRREDRLSTVEALRRAQLDAIQKQPSNHEWAAFVAIGGYASF